MTFEIRNHATIRAELLADWRGRYLERGWSLTIAEGSDAWRWADAIAHGLEGLEGRAAQLAKEIFPDTASSRFLERHAAVIGMGRKLATTARVRIAVTGTGVYTTSDRFVTPGGVMYAPLSGGSITGSGTVDAQALVAGTAGNLAPGSSISWSPTPAGLVAASSVNELLVVAVDRELDSDYAQRILAWWRERPGGGNRADWHAWGEGTQGVAAAFVYPLLHDTEGPDTPGAVTLCVMGPVPTLTVELDEPAAVQTRQVSGAVLDDLEDYLFGEGEYASEGGKIPATVDPDDIFVVTVQNQPQDIDVEVTLTGSFSFPWTTGPLAFTGGTTTQVTVATLPSGLVTGAFVAIPSSAVRGGYAYRNVTVSGSGPYTLTFDALGGPSTTGSVLPLPLNARLIRAAALRVFDALGPGTVAGGSARYPSPNAVQYPATLYRNSLVAALMGIPGVLDEAPVQGVEAVDVTLVGAADPEKVVPAVKDLVTCGTLRILPAP